MQLPRAKRGCYAAAMAGQTRKARWARRRKRRVDAADNDLSAADWESLVAAWGGCAYCRSTEGPFQKDCVLPISRGGRYSLDNVVPACRACNTSKWNDEVTAWMRRKKLDERAFLVRRFEIVTALRVVVEEEEEAES